MGSNERLRLHMKQVAANMKAWAIEKKALMNLQPENGSRQDCCTMQTGKNILMTIAALLLKNWKKKC